MKVHRPVSPTGVDDVCPACSKPLSQIGATAFYCISPTDAIAYALCWKCSRKLTKKGLPPKLTARVDDWVTRAAIQLNLIRTH